MPTLLPDLSVRVNEPELMDSPELERSRHQRALRGLARINVLSLTTPRVWDAIRALPPSPDRPLRVLDVACGGGDVAVALKLRARRAGIPLEVSGCDISPVALEHAEAHARKRGVDVTLFRHDASAEELPGGYDLVTSSLFLHHLSSAEAVRFLGAMAGAGGRILVQDLLRNALGYGLAWATVRAVSRSPVVHTDGPLSVRAAFTLSEVGELARAAGLEGARVRRCWPQRFLLRWEAE